MTELEKLEKEYKEANKKFSKKLNSTNNYNSYEEYEKSLEPEASQLAKVSRELRKIKPYKLTDSLHKHDDIMTVQDFIENCNCGGFIDYDGFGRYVKDGLESDIQVHPSDVEHGMLRDDFDHIVWYNR